jgi:iron complex outermembrane recepter protein
MYNQKNKKMKNLLFTILGLFISFSTFSQFSISGKITDNNQHALIGANIQLKGTFLGTFSGIDGMFSIQNLESGNYVLQVSYLGYEKIEKEIQLTKSKELSIELIRNNFITDEVIVEATRAGNKVPATYTNVNEEEIDKQNFGQDIPFLISLTPSFVATSDAGTGIGYTNFRIRGTDLNRINVTLNGIPMNDAESHGVWWVDLPDFAESVDNIQIQRGVGSSTNGASAFGATINLQTTTLNPEPYAKIKSVAGSFNTLKNTVSAGTGLIKDHFTFDARFSKVNSDGFIDRGWSDLRSYFISGGYYSKKSILRLNIFSGFEETYQAWNGIPSEILDTNRTWNAYTYENQVDHYNQDYYQLHFSHQLTENLSFNTAIHYTYGRGYYEQFKDDESLSSYTIDSVVLVDTIIYSDDIVRRKWLDNDFYGMTYSLKYKQNKTDIIIGGSLNKYDGDHFGKVISAQDVGNQIKGTEWYRNNGLKTDFNIFGKVNYQVTNLISLYGDLQFRKINHKIDGIDDDLGSINQEHSFNFFNPKMGMYFTIDEHQNSYFSFGIANREPNRSNFIDADISNPVPKHETLYDYEIGYEFNHNNIALGINVYYMDYNDQLVLTGKINDVGSAIMTNVKDSYRSGIEISTKYRISEWAQWEANVTFSRNKIKKFTEYVDNWDVWLDQVENDLGETNISFSPEIIANSILKFDWKNKAYFSLISSYVGEQYIDNTSNNDRNLDAYFVNNIRIDFTHNWKFVKNMTFQVLINNAFNTEYESNAWVYRYYTGGDYYKMDGLYPQAGRHFLAGITLKF